MNRPLVLRFLIGAAALLAGSIAVRAQQAQLAVTPSLGDAMPLVKTADGVHLRFPVLLNAHSVVQPASVLRLVYVDPNAGLHAHSGGGENHHMGGGTSLHHGPGDLGSNPYNNSFAPYDDTAAPNAKTVSSEASAEVWRDTQPFHDALNSAAEIGTMLVYAVPGKAKLVSAEIDLPGGMLLGNPSGRIVVLALTSDSEAGQGGLQPQDEIRTINGQPVPTNLEAFARFYHEVTEQARQANTSNTMQVSRPGQTALVEIKVGAPPSIPKMF